MPPGTEELTTAELLWNPATYWFWAAITFLFGLLFGSFFNVCIYRIPAGVSINDPKRSFCFRCGSMIRWYDNIPVISYLVLGGRCRDCGSSFSARYMAIELLTGILFAAVFIGSNPSPELPFQFATFWYLAFTGMLMVGSFTDLDTWIIPDGITIGGTVAALAAALLIGFVDDLPLLMEFGPFPIMRLNWNSDPFYLLMDILNGPHLLGVNPAQTLFWEPLANAVLGAVVGSGLLYSIGVVAKVILKKDAMGFGDVKLFALVGATLGVSGVFLTLMIACVLGATAGILGNLLARGKAGSSILEAELQRELEKLEKEESEESPSGVIADLEEIARNLPRPRLKHHLPFGPWIGLGAVLVIIFQEYFV